MGNASTSNNFFSELKIPNKYAVIEIGGTQLLVEEGRYYSCNHIKAKIGSKINFGRVHAATMNKKVMIGTPWIENLLVEGEILEEINEKKIVVYKMKPKSHT